jgi:DNA-binding GntR family transcriptional regulator
VLNGPEDLSEQLAAHVADLEKSIGDDRSYFDALERVWATLREACGNEALAEVSALLGRRSIPIRGMLLRAPGGHQTNYDLVADLGEATAARDPDAAAATAAAIIDSSRKFALEFCFLPTRDGSEGPRRLDGR